MTMPAPNLSDTHEDSLRPGDVLLRGQYRIESFLGAGGFGITYLARNSLDRLIVIKECFPGAICCRNKHSVQVRTASMEQNFSSIVRHFGREARHMAQLDHPNIVRVHEVFEENQTAYMVLDRVQGETLLDLIKDGRAEFEPEQVKALLNALLDAVSYIHANGILHRDISPDNIMIDGAGQPVLIDFGAARDVATSATRAVSALHVVKDGYSPQEYYLSGSPQTESSDLYSLAASFYHLITGAEPPNSQLRLSALAAEDPDPFEPLSPHTPGYDRFFIEALNRALAVFPKHRLQSANDWRDLIDEARRQEVLREQVEEDHATLQLIRVMVTETNDAIDEHLQQKAEQERLQAEAPAPPKPPRPAFLDGFDWEEDDDAAEDCDDQTAGQNRFDAVAPLVPAVPSDGQAMGAAAPRSLVARMVAAPFGRLLVRK